jgi:hypothetical protein
MINENIINKKIFLTFGNERYYNSLDRIKNEALSFNIFDKILIYNNLNLKNDFPDFWGKHENFIINNTRGYGYWIWKSFLVLKTLEKMNDNDILVYADAGCTLNNNGINRLNDYFEIIKNSDYGILSFNIGHLEKKYTKMDIFNELEMNTDEYLNSGQLMATIFILKKCNHTLKLINEWYNFSCIYHLIDDSESNVKNSEIFIENRHDQSIFSLILKKYGSVIIPDETYYPDYNDNIIKKIPILATRKT